MRLIPNTIAGRTIMVLIGGIVFILAASTAVVSLSLVDGAMPHRRASLIGRLDSLTSIVNAVPAAARPSVLSAIDHAHFRVSWTPHATVDVSRDWFTARLEKRLQRVLGRHGISAVAVGHAPAPAKARDALALVRGGPIVVWIELADGTWLNFVIAEGWHMPRWLVQFVAMIVIVGGGITGLAVWVARRVTAPLGRFAAAAGRLGTDVDAPPLSESGPSEISEAAQAFNLMQRRIRRFVEDRMLMLAAVSHDLRTPITRLRLRAEFVGEDEQRVKMLNDLDEMEAMIASTIAFAREETVSEPRAAIDLAGVVREIASNLVEAGHAVGVAGPDRLSYECRPTALKRAVANLIENAVTYGERAEIRLSDERDQVVITIDDNGPGIDEDERENVFTPFYRLDRSRSRATGGTGLGLSVARTVVRGHGGDITLTNRPQGGLRQMVVLPKSAKRAT